MKHIFANYGLSITLFLLMAVTLTLQGFANWHEFVQQQMEHGEQAQLGSEFMWYFGGRWAENAQSEFLQLFTFVVLTAYLIHRGSHESKDSDERMQQSLDRIDRRLELLEGSRAAAPGNGQPAAASAGKRAT